MRRAALFIFILCAISSLVIVSVDYTYSHHAENPLAHSSCLLCQAFSSFQMQFTQPLVPHLPGDLHCFGMVISESTRTYRLCVLAVIAPRPPPIATPTQKEDTIIFS